MDLGIVPGTKVSVMMRSPGGEPTAYNILGAGIALRKKQADNIFIIDNI
jgi:Fe2+ transport system protein FeoA